MAENGLRRHKTRAELYDNLLTEDPNDFAARVVADISAKAMGHAVDLYLSEMAYLLCNGFTVIPKASEEHKNLHHSGANHAKNIFPDFGKANNGKRRCIMNDNPKSTDKRSGQMTERETTFMEVMLWIM